MEITRFPFLFGGTFIEAAGGMFLLLRRGDFPSFSEGLSLRPLPSSRPGGPPGFPFLFGGTFIEGT